MADDSADGPLCWVTIETNADCNTRVMERGPKSERGTYGSTTLVDTEATAGLYVGIEEDQTPETLSLDVSSYHVENTESGRAFHAIMRLELSWDQASQLAAFLAYVIQSHAPKP